MQQKVVIQVDSCEKKKISLNHFGLWFCFS